MEIIHERIGVENYYVAECYEHFHANGTPCRQDRSLDGLVGGCHELHIPRMRWRDVIKNLVVTVGLNKLLDATFKTGYASPLWYIGLVDNAGFSAYAATDTMASHPGWSESVIYSNGTRPQWTPGAVAAGSVDNSAAKGVFNISGGGTIRGSFLANDNTKSGAGGILYGEGDYSQSRITLAGDTLNVQVSLTAA